MQCHIYDLRKRGKVLLSPQLLLTLINLVAVTPQPAAERMDV